jgi:hypothetical protein
MPGGKKPGPSIKKPDEYEALKDQGYSKSKAAAISNEAAKGPAARSKMAKKAARTRKERS